MSKVKPLPTTTYIQAFEVHTQAMIIARWRATLCLTGLLNGYIQRYGTDLPFPILLSRIFLIYHEGLQSILRWALGLELNKATRSLLACSQCPLVSRSRSIGPTNEQIPRLISCEYFTSFVCIMSEDHKVWVSILSAVCCQSSPTLTITKRRTSSLQRPIRIAVFVRGISSCHEQSAPIVIEHALQLLGIAGNPSAFLACENWGRTIIYLLDTFHESYIFEDVHHVCDMTVIMVSLGERNQTKGTCFTCREETSERRNCQTP